MADIYTVGHSNQSIDNFISLLKGCAINAVVDVRSFPYTSYTPHFNRDAISVHLNKSNIKYVYMGDLLGARYHDPSLLSEGQVDFKKVQQTQPFQKGIARIIKGLKQGYSIAFMCSEGKAICCHRFGLTARYLAHKGINVAHIEKENVKKQQDVEEELLINYEFKLDKLEMCLKGLNTRDALLDASYELLNKDIGYLYRAGEI